MWGSQWTPCWTWAMAKKASHILGGISVAIRSRDVVFPDVHHLRDCSGHHLGLLRTRFTGGRWGKVARSRAVAQDTWAGRGCRRCTCSGEIIWLSKTAWWHVHETGATFFSEVKSERTRGSRHKLEHGKCQLSIRKTKLPWACWMLEHTVQGVSGISILRNMLKECHQLSAQTGLALSQGLDHRTPTDPFHLTLS